MNNTQEWKKYEWLLTKLFYDKHFPENIEYNVRLIGRKSGVQRQVDILLEHEGKNIAIECKKYTRKVGLKTVESFIAMVGDVDIDQGLIISESGFTKPALQRIDAEKNVKAMSIPWDEAYESCPMDGYGRIPEVCPICRDCKTFLEDVPGIILWNFGLCSINDGVISMFAPGYCLCCNTKFLYCDPCGWITVSNNNYKCESCGKEYL